MNTSSTCQRRPNSPFVLSQLSGVFGSELAAPQTDYLIADRHASCGEQIFDVSKRECEPIVEPNSVGDDLRRKPMALIGRKGHRSSIARIVSLTCQYPMAI